MGIFPWRAIKIVKYAEKAIIIVMVAFLYQKGVINLSKDRQAGVLVFNQKSI